MKGQSKGTGYWQHDRVSIVVPDRHGASRFTNDGRNKGEDARHNRQERTSVDRHFWRLPVCHLGGWLCGWISTALVQVTMLNLCTVEHWLQFASGIFAALAAFTWLWASRVRAPSEITQDQMAATSGDIITPLDRLMKAIAKQSRLNATAALFAAFAALCQMPQAFLPTCWG
jgi:hypothetical protein